MVCQQEGLPLAELLRRMEEFYTGGGDGFAAWREKALIDLDLVPTILDRWVSQQGMQCSWGVWCCALFLTVVVRRRRQR